MSEDNDLGAHLLLWLGFFGVGVIFGFVLGFVLAVAR